MPTIEQTCANCTRPIGRLETAREFKGEMVCPQCYDRLRPAAAAVYSKPAPKPSQAVPTLFTIVGFLPMLIISVRYADAWQAGVKIAPWVFPVMALSLLTFVVGLAWFIVNRIRKD